MKKLLFFVTAMVGLFAASCSQDEPAALLPNAVNNQIGFTVTADNGSRSSSSYLSGLDIEKFTVSAWLTEKDYGSAPNYGEVNAGSAPYFTNDLLTRQEGQGAFSYAADARYWPQNGENLDFFAMVDGLAPLTFTADGPRLQGKIEQKGITEMPDMLYATAFDKAWDKNHNHSQQNVSFDFHHAFAKVAVSAKVKNNNLRVVITDMKIRGIIGMGEFWLGKKVDEGGEVVISSAEWKISNNDDFVSVACPMSEDVVLDNAISSEKQSLLSEEQGLLVIPNGYSGRNASKLQTYIELKAYAYNISNPENGFNAGGVDRLVYGKYDADGKPVPVKLCVPIEFDWAIGTCNHYTIVFECGNGGSTSKPDPDPEDPEDPENPEDPDPDAGLVRIGYEVEVTPWIEVTDNPDTEWDFTKK